MQQVNEAIDIAANRLRECYKVIADFAYFVTQYCYIEDKETSAPIKFDLWPSQREILPRFLNSLRLIILKARQLGLTWLTCCYCLWLAITKPLQLIVVISAKEDWAIEFLDRIKFVLARLPSWMVPPIKKETGQVLEFEHQDEDGKPVNSVIKSLPTTEEGAQSKTPTLLIIDESALNRYFKRIFASSKPGLDVAKGRMIVISNSIKTAPGWPFTRKIYVGSMTGDNDFERIFLPWSAHPRRPKDFIRRQIAEGMDEEDVSQHYPETEQEAISMMLGSYFGKTLARHEYTMDGVRGYLIRNKHGEIEFLEDKRGIVEIWRFPYHLVEGWDGDWWTKRYCIGSDVSEGLGLSYSVAYVMDRRLDELVVRVRTNRMDAYRWADQLYLLGQYYRNATDYTEKGVTFEDALICVERTGAGQTTVKRLLDLEANQYVKIMPGKQDGGWTKEYGWSETNQAKHDLSEDLRHWFRTMKGTMYDATLLDEASTWIQYEGTNRLGPEEGHFGDCVIAAGCTIQASNYLEGAPKRLKPPVTGWRAEFVKKRERISPWAI